ncbi:uncharacterized protein Z520_04049 [Fonsecaea multimorphosa CBS 102226]|uniref:Heterokaryon incompatibility domain-containing protein n=1 Tax=Fonsecaea multimorphosa CBS 102226 TaxID=1442371 RepID=A0A0D2KUF6_9EURO|nr:uncharacterized protein Z520_04049 [Fonsecaea multimorphosa CBS 102226]KIY00364.1 hypothetical protein Z520_04049 [Fonsecaea multimorphosa CBS 102226]
MDSPFILYDTPLLRIPYIPGPYRYDGLDPTRPFGEFPRRAGFCGSRNEIDEELLRSKSDEELSSLAQAWLFFGLLSEFALLDDPSPYIGRQSAMGGLHEYLVFKDMSSMVHRLRQRLVVLPFSEHGSWRSNLLECLHTVDIAVTAIDVQNRHLDTALPLVLLSIRLLVAFVKRVFELLEQPPPGFWTRNFIRSKFFSTKWLFLHALSASAYNEWLSTLKDYPTKRGRHQEPRMSDSLLLRLFEQHNWCPSQARRILELHDLPTANYFASINRRPLQRIDHSRCHASPKCVAHNVSLAPTTQPATSASEAAYGRNPEQYRIAHVTADHHCTMAKVEREKLVKIIRAGGIPLVCMTFGSTTLRIVEARPWTKYVAISHVWSGGLGNPNANALPECQVKKLQQCLRNVFEGLTFKGLATALGRSDLLSIAYPRRQYLWLDTLCVPVITGNDPEEERIKNKAISQMAAIYAGAESVIVLDAELQQSPVQPARLPSQERESLAAKIYSSAWMERSWTLQEGALARELSFQLESRVFRLGFEDLLDEKAPSWQHPLDNFVWSRAVYSNTFENDGASESDLHATRLRLPTSVVALTLRALQRERIWLTNLAPGSKREAAILRWKLSQFVEAWNSLIQRETSQKKDLYQIVANMLDLSPHEIRSGVSDISHADTTTIPPQQARYLPLIIRNCQILPISLLFNSGPRMRDPERPQNSWLPVETSEYGIMGDQLSACAGLSWRPNGLFLDKRTVHRESLVAYVFLERQERAPRFRIIDQNGGCETRWVVTVNEWMEPGTNSAHSSTEAYVATESAAERVYNEGVGTCILAERFPGGVSHDQSKALLGARFSIAERNGSLLTLRFDKPLLLLLDQDSSTENDIPVVEAGSSLNDFDFLVEYAPSPHHDIKLRRRPMLSARSPWTTGIAATRVLFIILPNTPNWLFDLDLPLAWEIVALAVYYMVCSVTLLFVIAIFPYQMIHMPLSWLAYRIWLNSFDPEWARSPMQFLFHEAESIIGEAERSFRRAFRRRSPLMGSSSLNNVVLE